MNDFFSKQSSIASWIFFFGIFLNVWHLQAQTGTVSVDFKNSSPKEIIENLESRTPYKFVYQKDISLDAPRITLKRENITIDELLDDLGSLTSLNFMRNENNIAVNRKAAPKKKGKIAGKAVDNVGLPLPGATIRVLEIGVAAIADDHGNYSLVSETGVYTVEASFVSYQTQKITGVRVTDSDSTPLDIVLKEDAQLLDEVVLTQTYQKATATTEGMLLEQKRAAQFSDGISAEQIARTPDKDVAASLKRITGVTTVEDRFVVVRSMGERWNQAVMDGINLPSTDAYQQNFAFDIIPTAMVESIVVSKTATPDMNANFVGGSVEIRTKAIPKKDFTSFSVGTSYNSRSAFKDRLTKQEGANDYLGFDDESRDYPQGLAPLEIPGSEAESGLFLAQSRRFTEDNFTTYNTYAAPGTSLQFALGRSFDFGGDGRWGFVGSLIFKNTQEQIKIDHTERGRFMENTLFIPEGQDTGSGITKYSILEQYGYKNSGASYGFNSTLGGMFNTGIQFGDHRISLRNTYMHIFDNRLTQITGWDKYGSSQPSILDGSELAFTQETSYPIYQNLLQNKIEGSHRFGKWEADWFAAYNSTSKDTKDATFLQTFRKKVGDDVLLYNQVYNNAGKFPMSRGYYVNDETDYNWGFSVSYSFDAGQLHNNIKFGYFGSYKRASNRQEEASLRAIGHPSNTAEINFPISELLNGTHYHWGGFGWQNLGFYGNEYKGEVKAHAPFLMLDNKLGDYVRFVWGVRAESFIYRQLSSQSSTAADFEADQKDDKEWQYLPSGSLIISPVPAMNIRLGYSKAVLRPQFSERLKIPYFDPVRSAYILNWTDGIVSSVAENYDFKFEWFPSAGEVLSFGLYRKDIKDPIEAVTQIQSEGSRYIFNTNSHSAKLSGIEVEIYKNLSFLGEGEALGHLFIMGNAAFNKTKVTSYVNLDGTGGLYKADRPLYGQSAYTYNLGIEYAGDRIGFSFRHNASGDQYIQVGYDYIAEEIRMPYSTSDAQVSYKLFKEKNLELKCGIKNLFDSPIETYNNFNSYRGKIREDYEIGDNPRDRYTLVSGASDRYDEGIDRKLYKAWTGRTINLTVTYNF